MNIYTDGYNSPFIFNTEWSTDLNTLNVTIKNGKEANLNSWLGIYNYNIGSVNIYPTNDYISWKYIHSNTSDVPTTRKIDFNLEVSLNTSSLSNNTKYILYLLKNDTLDTTIETDSYSVYHIIEINKPSSPNKSIEKKIARVKIYNNDDSYSIIKNDGNIYSWGSIYNYPKDGVYHNIFCGKDNFAALDINGCIKCWGNNTDNLNNPPDGDKFCKIVFNEKAAAAIDIQGNIITWGNQNYGGNITIMNKNFVDIFSNTIQFTAIDRKGYIFSWGKAIDANNSIQYPSTPGWRQIYSNSQSFCAINDRGEIYSWGNIDCGAIGNLGGKNYLNIISNKDSHTAINLDGYIFSWGCNSNDFPDSIKFKKIFSNDYAFAGIDFENKVHTWGNEQYGGKLNKAITNVTKIVSTHDKFTSLTSNGEVFTWGNIEYDEKLIPIDITFIDIYANRYSFAALTENGKIYTWGKITWGVLNTPTEEGYVNIVGNNKSFAALHNKNYIYTWGFSNNGEIVDLDN